jgi:aminoglycoside phosphotransferase (APT) family kinase protein
MNRPWEPEQLVEPEKALRLIQEQFPELNAKEIFFLGAGWDNTAYLINQKWIFRFPRRQISVPLLQAEIQTLPKLALRLPTPIPTPQWIGKPTPEFTWPFAGYPILPGITACHANLTNEERISLAVPIAQFLKALHAVPITILSETTIFGDNLGRIDPASIIERIKPVFDDLEKLHLLENRDKLERIIDRAILLPRPELTKLVHGDFYLRHILLNDEHHLAGVIDWGDIHVGNEAIDLAIAHAFLPKEAHAAFKEAYGPITDRTWQLAELRAIYSSAYILLFGHHKPDPDLMREGSRSLHQIAT